MKSIKIKDQFNRKSNLKKFDNVSIDKYIDSIFSETFPNSSCFYKDEIIILSNDIQKVKNVIHKIAKKNLGKRITIKDIRAVINEAFNINFDKNYLLQYALRQIGINWHQELFKQWGIYKENFVELAKLAQDDEHRVKCQAMALVQQGRSFSRIEKDLNLLPGTVGKLFKTYIIKKNKLFKKNKQQIL